MDCYSVQLQLPFLARRCANARTTYYFGQGFRLSRRVWPLVFAGREVCPLSGGLEVVPISEVEMYYACYDRLGAGSLSVLRRLSASRSVHYRRLHCIGVTTHYRLFTHHIASSCHNTHYFGDSSHIPHMHSVSRLFETRRGVRVCHSAAT